MPYRTRRVKFTGVEVERLATSGCTASVALEWQDQTYVGAGDAAGPDLPELWCAGRATTEAMQQVVEGHGARFDVLDIETVQALGAPAVVVALAIHHREETQYVVGFCMVKEDPAHAGVRAVLNGTNRFLGRLLEERG